LDLRRIGDFSWDDRYCITELLARSFAVTREYAHRLLACYQFGHQGATQEAGRACYHRGHDGLPAPE
jgi:hypothetical protein